MDMRVLLVTGEFPPDVGGIASHVAELARALAPHVPGIEVVHPRSIWGAVPVWNGADCPVHRPGVIMAEPAYQPMLRTWLTRKLKREPVDILHVHGVRPLAATRGLPAKTIFTNHSSGFLARLNASPARKRRTVRLLEHVDYVVGPSDELVDAARAFGYRGPARMIANGVDSERFSPATSALRRNWNIGEDDIVILLARRLVEKNGVTDFVRSLGYLEPGSFRVVVAGDGPERSKMTATLGEANLLDRVLFLGAVPNADMPSVYGAADISVLPSLAEATSISGLEAMASGIPLVGTKVGGIPAIIADAETGLLVAPGQPEEIAAALRRLISDRTLRKSFGAAARIRVEREFSWAHIALKTLQVYRECMNSGRAQDVRASGVSMSQGV
jgi:glycosyltransferase involved in cell wall biosynthesis